MKDILTFGLHLDVNLRHKNFLKVNKNTSSKSGDQRLNNCLSTVTTLIVLEILKTGVIFLFQYTITSSSFV